MTSDSVQNKKKFLPASEMQARDLLDLLLSWENQSWGEPTSTWQALIPGLAHAKGEINDGFLSSVHERNFSNLAIRNGNLVKDKVSKLYTFVAQGLGDGVLTIMAVRLESKGSDLFVKWEHYGLKMRLYSDQGRALRYLGGGASILALGITVFTSGLLAQKLLSEAARGRTVTTGNIYSNYQANDAWAFREGIHSCLKETFNAAGVSIPSIKEIHHHI